MNEIQHYLPQVRASLCGNFPSPHDGETLFSVCSRFHQLSAEAIRSIPHPKEVVCDLQLHTSPVQKNTLPNEQQKA